jgi:phage tail-like protein
VGRPLRRGRQKGERPEAPHRGRKDLRKDLIVELYNEAGQVVLAYKVFRAWVSEYQATADLDASANAVAIQHITLENEGWERDYDVTRRIQPS